LLDIADRDKLGIGLFEEGFQHITAARPDADGAKRDAVAGGHGAIAAERAGGDDRRHADGGDRHFEKVPASGDRGHGNRLRAMSGRAITGSLIHSPDQNGMLFIRWSMTGRRSPRRIGVLRSAAAISNME